jgi:hypothetical protein
MSKDNCGCWFWNINIEKRDFFASELKNGLLREEMGTAGEDKESKNVLDLQNIKESFEKWQEWGKDKQGVWQHCNPVVDGDIEINDLIVVKNVPDSDHFTLVRVDSKLDKDKGVLQVKVLGEFHKYSKAVPPHFVRTLNSTRYLIRRTMTQKEAILKLALKAKQIEEAKKQARETVEKLTRQSKKVTKNAQMIMELVDMEGDNEMGEPSPFYQWWKKYFLESMGRVWGWITSILLFLFGIISVLSSIFGFVVDLPDFWVSIKQLFSLIFGLG